jgi:hypothetical protein
MPYLSHHFITGLSSIEVKILWKDYLQSVKASTKVKLAQPPTKRKRDCEIERRSSTNSNDETKDKENEPLRLDPSDHSQNSSILHNHAFLLSTPPKFMNPKKARAGDDSQASQFQEQDGFRSPT